MFYSSKRNSGKSLFIKHSVFIISGIFLSIFNSQLINAQTSSTSASATISASIVTAIGITKTVDMNFGNLAIGTTSGTLILSPDGSRFAAGGITLPTVTGSVTAASFQITGEGSYTYTITLPKEAYTITSIAGSETMLINNFTSSPSNVGMLTAGSQTVLIGATLVFNANQSASEYKNETGFEVAVNYN